MFAPRLEPAAPAFVVSRVAHCNVCQAVRVFQAGVCGACLRNAHACTRVLRNGRCIDCGFLGRALELGKVSP